MYNMDILDIIIGILILLIVGVVIWMFYEIIKSIYYLTLRYETFPSVAKVCKKEHENEYTTTTMMTVGNVMVPQFRHHDEEYNVYLMYEEQQHCINDEDLYNSVNIDDVVNIFVHKGYNKKDEVKDVYLSTEE